MAQQTGDDGSEDTLPDGHATDADGWPARDSGVPIGLADVQAVFLLAGNAVIHEYGDGPARANRVGVSDWYGPSPEFDPYNEGEDAVSTYSVVTPSGSIAIRESDVARIHRPDGERCEED